MKLAKDIISAVKDPQRKVLIKNTTASQVMIRPGGKRIILNPGVTDLSKYRELLLSDMKDIEDRLREGSLRPADERPNNVPLQQSN